MLKIMNDLPDNVLGVCATGEITATDYETVLIPVIEEKIKRNKKIRVLYQLTNSVEGFELSAMIDDAKVAIGHASALEKMALVSDHHLINAIAKFFSHFMPCKFRIFKNSDLDAAKKWLADPTMHSL